MRDQRGQFLTGCTRNRLCSRNDALLEMNFEKHARSGSKSIYGLAAEKAGPTESACFPI